jgi:hypothetical protein
LLVVLSVVVLVVVARGCWWLCWSCWSLLVVLLLLAGVEVALVVGLCTYGFVVVLVSSAALPGVS